MSGFNVAAYRLDVFSPEVDPAEETSEYRWAMTDKRLLADLPAMLEAVEEDLQDLMPDGYTVRLTPFSGS